MDLHDGNKEQARRMGLYRKRISKEVGFDIGETGYFAWIEKYSDKFRKWVDSPHEDKGETGFIGKDFIED